MSPKASVVHHPRTKNWLAQYYQWDKDKGGWKRIQKTTKTPVKWRAMAIATEFQALALAASPQGPETSITREYVLDVVNSILRAAGHTTIEETRRWEEYSREWLRLIARKVSARTLESYEGHIRVFTRWLGKEANCPINTITGEEMQTWYLEMIDAGRKPETVNNFVKLLQQVFDRARAEGFCQRNPVELIMRIYGESDTRTPFDVQEVAKVLAHLKKAGLAEWLTASLLGICTGQRLSDCCKCSWESINRTGKDWVWRCDQGKTGTVVEIPIIDPLASHLRALATHGTKGLLCPSLAGVQTGGPDGLSYQFSQILDAAGIVRDKREKVEGSKGQSWTNKTFHSFRHTCNSLLANAGVSEDVRRKILGHSSVQVNAIYTHLQDATSRTALEKAIGAALAQPSRST